MTITSQPGPFWLDPDRPELFPDVSLALHEPDGLLAVGGDLSPERILHAYSQGIFPWYSDGQPILWWSPDPRAVLYPAQLKISRSLRKTLRKQEYQISLDQDFRGVIQACAEPREEQEGTWITDEMRDAYINLHNLGYAHSVEAWYNDELVGGVYGISIGRIFYGESMFARRTDASKVAFVHLVKQLANWDFKLIDCQVSSEHLFSLGAVEIPRYEFLQEIQQLISEEDWTDWNMAASATLLSDIIEA
ncbi:MAG: leucyl/phenylalanyl-tRNA--protein transferase [Gammaproteobacteria bacterium]|nr:leucyl/phenylalanyl-tRNA--protein transferase [Gammaproteobacteria bacterium]